MRCHNAPLRLALTTLILTILAVAPCPRRAQADPASAAKQFNLQRFSYDLEYAHGLRLGVGFRYAGALKDDWSPPSQQSSRPDPLPLLPIRLPIGPNATGVDVSPDFLLDIIQPMLPRDRRPHSELAAAIADLDRQDRSSTTDAPPSFRVFDYSTIGGAFTAVELQSDLDVVFSGSVDVGERDKPLSFDSKPGRLQVSLQFDAPLTHQRERNPSQ